MKRLLRVPILAGLILMQAVYATGYEETQTDVARRIALDGERAANRGDARGVIDAKTASKKAGKAKTVEQARQIEKIYNKDNFN